MAAAFMRREEMAHRRQAWFTAHTIATCGMFRERPNLKRLIADLNAPVDRKSGEITISSVADVELFKKTYGIDLLPNG